MWKGPPNRLDDVLALPGPDAAEVELLRAEMRGSLDLFEQLLTGREHLAGDEFSAADCSAYPFLKYGLHGASADDDESFHHVLADTLVVLALLHVCGVVYSSLRHRENLVAAMVSGRKRAPGSGDVFE